MVTLVDFIWCKKQKKGIKLIEPNINLSKEYMEQAEETLDILKLIKGKSRTWLATTKYYCEYFAIYSLLMRLGIRCEIHECTIKITKLLEDENIIPSNYSQILEEDKELRIANQYYLKNRDVPLDYNQLTNFVLEIKDINLKINNDLIKKIREKIKKSI